MQFNYRSLESGLEISNKLDFVTDKSQEELEEILIAFKAGLENLVEEEIEPVNYQILKSNKIAK